MRSQKLSKRTGSAQSTIEYIVIISLIVGIVIVVVSEYGSNVRNLYVQANEELAGEESGIEEEPVLPVLPIPQLPPPTPDPAPFTETSDPEPEGSHQSSPPTPDPAPLPKIHELVPTVPVPPAPPPPSAPDIQLLSKTHEPVLEGSHPSPPPPPAPLPKTLVLEPEVPVPPAPPPPPPPAPGPPPDPIPVGSEAEHRLGFKRSTLGLPDGYYDAARNWVIDGVHYQKNFNVNLSELKSSGVQYATLEFNADVHAYGIYENITGPITFNGKVLGTIKDGKSTFRIPVSLMRESNALSFSLINVDGVVSNANTDYKVFYNNAGHRHDIGLQGLSLTWDETKEPTRTKSRDKAERKIRKK